MEVTPSDRDILRKLGERIARIASEPGQKQTVELWRRLNMLDGQKPMIHIYQIPWAEMNVDDELTLGCESRFGRQIEEGLRRRIYQWDHMRGDMVMEPVIDVGPVLHGDDYGIQSRVNFRRVDPENPIRSRYFIPQIKNERDIEKIRIPEITYDKKATLEKKKFLEDIFTGILDINLSLGSGSFSIAPWDKIVQWTGVEEVLTDLALRPHFIHRLMDRITRAYEARLTAYHSFKLLSLNNRAVIVGQGGYGYTDELPGEDYEPDNVGYQNLWGGGMAQIFSEVSPEMHEEFALKYEMRCLKHFGLVYYGCCEPLHHKVDLARKMIPRLRKISMSPFVDVKKAVEAVGDTLVYSCKPNPAYLASDRWDPEVVRKEIKKVLDAAQPNGCHVEIILKDISTVHHEPKRLWEWAKTVSETASEYTRN